MEYKPRAMNLELTTCCPLHCPQCYCTLNGGKHLDYHIAVKRLQEAAEAGVVSVNLSGGETTCYPRLVDLVREARNVGISPNIATSGYHFTQELFDSLCEAGIEGIYISLNGSQKEINELSRDGYQLAIDALKLLDMNHYQKSFINWVMHSNNADDFDNVVCIAEKYHINHLVILSFKPDSHHQLDSFPSSKQIVQIAEFIKNYRGHVKIMIETCFSQLLAVCFETKLLGNLNVGLKKGCGAGRWMLNIDVDGRFSPCRHLDYYEQWDSLQDYWSKSSVLDTIRSIEEKIHKPCCNCYYQTNCRHCLAINSKLHGELYLGFENCTLGNYR